MANSFTELIEQGYTLVTASTRLGRHLLHRYAGFRIEKGDAVWQSPDILPWQAWLSRAWNELEFSRQSGVRLLGDMEQRYLWQQIIQTSPYAGQLLQINTVIDQVMAAYALCRTWNIQVFPGDIYLNHDATIFRIWVEEYERKLKDHNWIDHHGITDYLCREKTTGAGNRIAFYGFDELTPRQQLLISVLGEHGNTVKIVPIAKKNKNTRYISLDDYRDEIRAAALWSRQIVNDDPGACIGIAVPDLRSVREDICSVFDGIFHPQLLLQHHDAVSRYYSISLGRPLSDYPAVHAALEILTLGTRKQALDKLSALLRSVFIKGAVAEAGARAGLDALMRKTGEAEWQLQSLLRLGEQQVESARAQGFLDMIKEYEIHFLSAPRQQSPAEWAMTFSERLQLMGWPGDRELDSIEFQVLNAWKQALSRLAAMSSVLGSCSCESALSHLLKSVRDTGFQPETGEVPVQILGVDGAAGMQFDYLWVMGLHDQVWPPVAQPNPFIPLSLQRESGYPYSSAELTLERTRMLTQRLVDSAGEVVLSYPAMEADRECRISPLLREYSGDAGRLELEEVEDYECLIYKSAEVEIIHDTSGPPLHRSGRSSGGSAIFKDQSACPFRAYAKHRLYAQGLAEVDIGLSAAVRGSLVHKVMQYLWQRLKTSAELHAHTPAAIQEMVTSVVTAAVNQQARQQPETFTGRFREIETARLVKLATTWLDLERDRAAFSVLSLEHSGQVSINGLQCDIRIDRIDALADGTQVILDYKTGAASIQDWEGERPQEPQLPLYAISNKGDVGAIAFARIKQGDSGFAGLAGADDLLPGVKAVVNPQTAEPAWAARLGEWEVVINRLADQFIQGDARVDPRDAKACRYCDLHTLCRIHEYHAVEMGNADLD